MGIERVTILHDESQTFRGSIASDEFDVRYLVKTDAPYNDAYKVVQDAVNAGQLPGPGSSYDEESPYTCRELDCDPVGDANCQFYIAIATFSNDQETADDAQDPERFDPEDPELDTPDIVSTTEKFKRPMFTDYRRAPGLNSAGDMFNPLPEALFVNKVVTYTWNTPNLLDLEPISGTLNDRNLSAAGVAGVIPKWCGFITEVDSRGPFFRKYKPPQSPGLAQSIPFYKNTLTLSITNGDFNPAGNGIRVVFADKVIRGEYTRTSDSETFTRFPHPEGHQLLANVGLYQILDHTSEPHSVWTVNGMYTKGDVVAYKGKHYIALKDNGTGSDIVPSPTPGSDEAKGVWLLRYLEIEKKRILYRDIDPSLRGGDEDIGDDPVDEPQWLDLYGQLIADQGPPNWAGDNAFDPPKYGFLYITAPYVNWISAGAGLKWWPFTT